MNRRELLKYFGIGASIVPVVDGMPKIEAAASLIEVPKVEVVQSTNWIDHSRGRKKLLDAFMKLNPVKINVSIDDGSGVIVHFSGRTYLTRASVAVKEDATRHDDDPWWIGRTCTNDWTLEGVMTGAVEKRITRR